MDVIDIGKAVLRRWYVVLGVMAVGAVVALYAASTVETYYTVQAQVLVVGPKVETEAEPVAPGESTVPVNPYARFSGSLNVTALAIARIVDGAEFRAVVADEELEGEFSFEPAGDPFIAVVTEAPTPGAATALAERVVQGLSEALASVQAEVGVPPESQITLRDLTTSEPIEETGKARQVFLGVMAVSALLAVVVAVTVDLRVRRRGGEFAGGDGPVPPGWSGANTDPARVSALPPPADPVTVDERQGQPAISSSGD